LASGFYIPSTSSSSRRQPREAKKPFSAAPISNLILDAIKHRALRQSLAQRCWLGFYRGRSREHQLCSSRVVLYTCLLSFCGHVLAHAGYVDDAISHIKTLEEFLFEHLAEQCSLAEKRLTSVSLILRFRYWHLNPRWLTAYAFHTLSWSIWRQVKQQRGGCEEVFDNASSLSFGAHISNRALGRIFLMNCLVSSDPFSDRSPNRSFTQPLRAMPWSRLFQHLFILVKLIRSFEITTHLKPRPSQLHSPSRDWTWLVESKFVSLEYSFLIVTRLEQQNYLNSVQLYKTLQSSKIRRWSLIPYAPRSGVDIQCGESDRGPRSWTGSIRNLHPQESCHHINIPKKYIKPGFSVPLS
jgi:hypothetical protein